ncbi:hypothetical protein ACEPAF_5462 [Sanghuangporus sanghuang]
MGYGKWANHVRDRSTLGKRVTLLALSPDGSRIILGSRDKAVRIWYILDPLQLSRRHVVDAMFAPTSEWVKLLCDDGWIRGRPERCNVLLRIPPDLYSTLCPYRNLTVFISGSSAGDDFTGAALGERWTGCLSPELKR